ncbi:MAG: Trk system potassium transporter TrkA [Opitutales bacterium]
MKIIVAGAGDVGSYLCQILSESQYDVTLIETNEDVAGELEESLDIRVILGNGASAKFQQKAGVANCDFFMSMTADDQSNIVACSIAKQLGAKKTIARVHDELYADCSILNYQDYFSIDYFLNPEALSAIELAKIIRNPERVAVENFARGLIEVQQLELSPASPLLNKALKNLRLDSDIRLGYVQRRGKLSVAGADTVLEAGDVVTLFGSTEGIYKNKKLFTKEKNASMLDIVLYGATETAISLINMLNSSKFKIRLIDPDLTKCKAFAEKFSNITVINGAATSLQLLEEEHIAKADYFISCTKKDEDNIVTSLQAKKLGVEHVCLLINKPDYEELLGNMSSFLSIELSVSPRKATANEILKIVSLQKAVRIASLQDGQIEILETIVASGSKVENKEVMQASLPKGCMLVALVNKDTAIVPTAHSLIKAGDSVILIVSKEKINEAIELFR